MITLAVCGKCGKTQEWDKAKASGWLQATIPNTDGHMIVRCSQHITGHALRQAGLPQQRTSKRIRDNIDRGFWVEYSSEYTACVGKTEPVLTDDEVDDGGYYISYHKGAMPEFNSETFGILEALILAMRKVEPDLRKWNLTELIS